MEKGKIKSFAINARNELIRDITQRLENYGIDKDGVKSELDISTSEIKYYTSEHFGLSGSQIKWRHKVVNELKRRANEVDWQQAFTDLVEEVAYTWFNRIIAIRFMEVNDYLPTRTRVLSSEEGRSEPDILIHALELEEDFGHYSDEEREIITRALDTLAPHDLDQMYEIMFIKQSDALQQVLPHLFEPTADYMKLLFTPRYNRGVIKELLTEIPESYFDIAQEGQVEIIGWLYQYYNTEPKDQVISLPKSHKYRDTELAHATQIFTPDWIVKYMVQNSVGKYWILKLIAQGDLRSEKEIAVSFNWQYYMEDAEQSTEINEKLKVSNDNLKKVQLSDLTVIDPSMGSGHILVYAFDLLMDIYHSEGYSQREAAQLIIKNNLFGLDIDTRAFQLSYFAIMMKFRQYDRRAFSRNTSLHLFPINFNNNILKSDLDLIELKFGKNTRHNVETMALGLKDANDLGSLLDTSGIGLQSLKNIVTSMGDEQLTLESQKILDNLSRAIPVIELLQKKYSVIVTNPPYMGSARMNTKLSSFAKKYYPNSKSDMFAMFIERWNKFLLPAGYNAMVTMQSWMFLSSFEKMRIHQLKTYTISNLMHMENNVMGIAFGTAVTIFKNVYLPDFNGTYHQIKTADTSDNKIPDKVPIPGNRYNRTNQTNFSKIPGNPIAYWASANLVHDFEIGTKMDKLVEARQGLATADNNRFLRQWFEVNVDKIKFDAHSIDESLKSHKKWFPYNKGGSYRKWYGNYDYVVNWENDGNEIRNFKDDREKLRSRPQNTDYYFREAITWSAITSWKSAFRLQEPGSIFDHAAYNTFPVNFKILALLNSNVSDYIIRMINPTINTGASAINSLPIITEESVYAKLRLCVSKNILITKNDWNSFEISWNFTEQPILNNIAEHKQNWTIQEAYSAWEKEADDRFNQLKANEEELNRIFIDLYGLQDELTPEEEEKDVSVRRADRERDIKSFLSYFIGCVFGRYSLDVEGLAFAGGDWNDDKYQSFHPNEDNIILLTDSEYFDDRRDIINRLREFLTTTFGKNNLDENMQFIAESLDEKKSQKGVAAEDIIRAYFLNDFYKDHDQIYQKRPIYWEFNSGRNKGFKALMYLHRYDSDGLAMIRGYLHDLQSAYEQTVVVRNQQIEIESDTRTKNGLKKEVVKIQKQIDELVKYDEALQHQSMNSIELDLDDGVLVNHAKLQGQEKLLTKL